MDFQSAMETFAEAWVAANTGKIVLGNGSGTAHANDNSSDSPPLQGTLQQQHQAGGSGGNKASCESGKGNTPGLSIIGSSDYPKIPSGMDLSSSSSTGGILPGTVVSGNQVGGSGGGMTTSSSSPATNKRLKGMSGSRKLSPSRNHNSNNHNGPPTPPDFHSSLPTVLPNSSPLGSSNNPNSVGKSMPIHCIIEVVTTTTATSPSSRNQDNGNGRRESLGLDSRENNSNNNNNNNNNNSISNNNNNNIIEKIMGKDLASSLTGGNLSLGGNKVVEVDDFVIIPAGTLFQEVVGTVLTLLGYPKDTIRQAEGTITLRNWKPLRLDQVCDSGNKTVGDILNDLTNHATLKVLVTRAKGGSAEDLKDKLLRLLLAHSSTLLIGAGCPLDEVTMNQLVKGQWPQNLAEDVKRRFDQWYKSFHPGAAIGLLETLQHTHGLGNGPTGHHNAGNILPGGLTASNGSIHHPHSHHHHPSHHNHLVNGSTGHHHQLHDLQPSKVSAYTDDEHNHPVFHGLTTQKTRMRTSFDPEMELPKLQQWFAENPHPSRHQIQQYVRELNLLDCRKDRKPLDVNNVIYWFKNARAAQKRNELRYNGLPPHHHPSVYGHHGGGSLGRSGSPHHHHSGAHLLHGHHHPHGSLVDLRERLSGGGGGGHHGGLHGGVLAVCNGVGGESGNDNSVAGSSSRDSDDQDQGEERDKEDEDNNCEEGTWDDVDGRGGGDEGNEEKVRLIIKDERDEDYIHVVDVDGGGGQGNEEDEEDGKNVINNNEEEPKDLSSKSPGSLRGDTGGKKRLRALSKPGSGEGGSKEEDGGGEVLGGSAPGTTPLEGEERGEVGGNGSDTDDAEAPGIDKKRVKMEKEEKDIIRVEQEDEEDEDEREDHMEEDETEDGDGGRGRQRWMRHSSAGTPNYNTHLPAHHETPIASHNNQQKEITRRLNQNHGGGGVVLNERGSVTSSSSISPRSSPGLSPPPHNNNSYGFDGPPSMVNRFHAFFEHPSFMYRHFNSFNFGPNFPHPGGGDSAESSVAAYQAALSAAVGAGAGSGRKGALCLPPGKSSATGSSPLDIFHDFPSALISHGAGGSGRGVVVGGGGSSGSGLGSAGGGGGGSGSNGGNLSVGCGDPLARLRGEELFPSRPPSSADIISSIINARGEFNPLNLGNPHHPSHHSNHSLGMDERRKRNRTFIDPVTEVVLLENWFKIQTHPSHNMILKYTEELNRMPYRQKFPKLEPKNVQFWFKNRRAKCKRLKMNM